MPASTAPRCQGGAPHWSPTSTKDPKWLTNQKLQCKKTLNVKGFYAPRGAYLKQWTTPRECIQAHPHRIVAALPWRHAPATLGHAAPFAVCCGGRADGVPASLHGSGFRPRPVAYGGGSHGQPPRG